MSDVATFLGDTDESLDGRIRQVEQRQQGICGLSGPYRRRLVLFLLFFLDRDFLGLAHHACLLKRMPGDRAPKTNAPYSMRGESGGRGALTLSANLMLKSQSVGIRRRRTSSRRFGVGIRPPRWALFRASLRARRIASAFSRVLCSDGFS